MAASYFSSLLTTTTSRVATIRQNLLSSDNDGDTEDDTHICRVLRAYYTEKGRSFPAWLPPDPKAPPPVVVQPVYSQSSVGARYGGLQSQGGAAGGGGPLSSLWDSQPPGGAAQQDQQSFRRGRGAPMGGNRMGGPAPQERQNPFMKQPSSQESQAQARPLPSQRAGSYQSVGGSSYGRSETPPGSSAGRTAQDRLKDRFKGGKTPSPAGSTSQGQQSQRSDSYGVNASSGGSGYSDDRYGSPGGGYGEAEKPFVAATSPWASNEAEFGGGYDSRAGRQALGGGGRQGLPSGPAGGRRPGLPSGPKRF